MGGVGIKYPISKKVGIEMNFNYSPSLNLIDFEYGSSGFIKTGIKIYFSLDRSVTNK